MAKAVSLKSHFKKTNTEPHTQKTALVTGGAGFIGSNLIEDLLLRGFIVFAVDNLITGKMENISKFSNKKNFYFFEMDVVSNSFIKNFRPVPLNYIYHLACPTGVPNIKTLGEEMLLASSLGTRHALELARHHGAFFVYASSAEVYGNPEVYPQTEDYCGNVHPTGPRSAYEEGKRFAESLIKLYSEKHGVNSKIIRIFNTYGPGMSLSDMRVFPQFIRAILEARELLIYGNGMQTRTSLFIEDLLLGIHLVVEKGTQGEIYNIGGTDAITINDLARLVLKIANRTNTIIYKPHFIEDHHNRMPCIKKIMELGWVPKISLEEGLRRMVSHYGIVSEIFYEDVKDVKTVSL